MEVKIDPKNIEFVDLSIGKKKEKGSELVFRFLQNLYLGSLLILELSIVAFILITILIWLVKIVIFNDIDIINRVMCLSEIISKNWIAFLFFAGILLFRIIVLKLTTLRYAKGVIFDSSKNLQILDLDKEEK